MRQHSPSRLSMSRAECNRYSEDRVLVGTTNTADQALGWETVFVPCHSVGDVIASESTQKGGLSSQFLVVRYFDSR
jgi:hypothetical protein